MTIRTNRPQVFYGVNLILFSDTREFAQVMNVDQSLSCHTIYFLKSMAANNTPHAIVFNALSSCFPISLEGIHCNTFYRTLIQSIRFRNLVGYHEFDTSKTSAK